MCNMKYEHFIKQPMPAIQLKTNIYLAKHPQLIIALDRNKNHPLIRKVSHISFNT